MFGLAPPAKQADGTEARRTDGSSGGPAESSHADRVVFAHGDRYYGEVTTHGKSFLVRERSPYKGKIDLKKLSECELGEVQLSAESQVHARSDEDTAVMHGQAEMRILAQRVERDYELFLKDHAKGTFDFVSAVDQL